MNFIEKKCIKTLEQNFGDKNKIDPAAKEIIFCWCGWSIFKNFHNHKERLAFLILVRWFKYNVYEEKMRFLGGYI